LIYGSLVEIAFNALLSLIVVVVILVFTDANLSWASLMFLPIVLIMVLLGVTISLFIMPIASLYTDIQFAMPYLMQFLMYLTPVIYPKPDYKGFGSILEWNPVAPLLTEARNLLLGIGPDTNWNLLLIITAVLCLLFLVGILFNRLIIQILIERMGS